MNMQAETNENWRNDTNGNNHEASPVICNSNAVRTIRTRSALERISFSNPFITCSSTAAASSLRCTLGKGLPKMLMIRQMFATNALDQVVEFVITPGCAMQTSTPSFSVRNLRTVSSVLHLNGKSHGVRVKPRTYDKAVITHPHDLIIPHHERPLL